MQSLFGQVEFRWRYVCHWTNDSVPYLSEIVVTIPVNFKGELVQSLPAKILQGWVDNCVVSGQCIT